MATFVQATKTKQLVLSHVAIVNSKKRREGQKKLTLWRHELGVDNEEKGMVRW